MSDSITKYHENLETMTKNSEIYTYTVNSPQHPFYSDTSFSKTQDQYVQSVKDKYEERSQVGIKKYNTTLERDDLSLTEWLTHAQEEAMDFTLYLERIMAKIKEKELDL